MQSFIASGSVDEEQLLRSASTWGWLQVVGNCVLKTLIIIMYVVVVVISSVPRVWVVFEVWYACTWLAFPLPPGKEVLDYLIVN